VLGIGKKQAIPILPPDEAPPPLATRAQLELFPDPPPTGFAATIRSALGRTLTPSVRAAICGTLRTSIAGLVLGLGVAPSLGVDHFTERRMVAYVQTHPDAAPIKQLTPQQMRIAFGRGPYHEHLGWLAKLPGFIELARDDPRLARRLYDLAPTFDVVAHVRDVQKRHGAKSAHFRIAAEELEAIAPKARLIIVPGDFGSRMLRVIESHSETPWIPALRLSATPDADHNGAFAVSSGPAPDHLFSEIGKVPRDLVYIPPSTLEIGPNGERAKDFKNVAWLSSHGTSFGFAGISTGVAAQAMAEEIVRRDARLSKGQVPIRFVVLESCSQGDPTLMFLSTNAARFQEALDKALDGSEHGPVTVLAAQDPGLLYVSGHQLTEAGMTPVVFVSPDRQRRTVDPDMVTALELLGGATGLGLGSALWLRHREKKRIKPPSQ
jgi:hypothetical protein